MSTIVAVSSGQNIVIGADSLTTFGDTLEGDELIDGAGKLIHYEDNVIAICGHASAKVMLQAVLEDGDHFAFHSKMAIYRSMNAIHRIFRNDYFLLPGDDDAPFESSHMSMLIGNPTGIYGVYDLRSVQKYRKYYAFGTGEEIALGAMYTEYLRNPDAESVALAGLKAAAALDAQTAEPLEIVTLRANEKSIDGE